MSDPIVLLSIVGGVMTAVNQTLVRRKHWIGWALGIPNILLFMFVNWQSGAYGYAVLLGPFWLFNAVLAIRQWRIPTEPITTEKEALGMKTLTFAFATVLTTATAAFAGGPKFVVSDTALASGVALALLVAVHVGIRHFGRK